MVRYRIMKKQHWDGYAKFMYHIQRTYFGFIWEDCFGEKFNSLEQATARKRYLESPAPDEVVG